MMKTNCENHRSGNAITELVVAMIILFTIIFGTIEASNAIYMQQFITEVSYQGAITGVKPGATEEIVVAKVNSILEGRGIEDAEITVEGVDGTDFDDVASGDPFNVIVQIPADGNFNLPGLGNYMNLESTSQAIRQ